MSAPDHAAIVTTALDRLGFSAMTRHGMSAGDVDSIRMPAYKALRALVAERDARGWSQKEWLELLARAEAAEDDLRATEKLATDERERRIAAEAERDEALAELVEAKKITSGIDKDLFTMVCYERDEAQARVAELEAELGLR